MMVFTVGISTALQNCTAFKSCLTYGTKTTPDMKSSFLQTALFALLLVAFQDLSRSQKDQSFNDAADLNLPEPYDIGWMKSIDNNKFISDITVPGTHDTMALHWGSFVECQAWSLETQLKAGIRYLDLRTSLTQVHYTWRHNQVLRCLAEVQESRRTFVNVFPPSFCRLATAFAWEGERSSQTHHLKTRHRAATVGGACDWKLMADLGQ
ncbi:hypothetical protein AALO_G00182990 [Alosa alosa]|uniref:Phosphatidylinositol-specific phospholipase C X domain-containing protein n=1 Tax=Alosa alosa TaxID=278164 RepID=A0AAV6G999_9TELE|nr:hypothetical protein AALO_G00182990 [Alosa alosa]